jgi:predicted transcriptional regulator
MPSTPGRILIGDTAYAVPFRHIVRELTEDEFKALDRSIAEIGVTHPLTVATTPTHGKCLIDGWNRRKIASLRQKPLTLHDLGDISDLEAENRARDSNIRRALSGPELDRLRAERVDRVAALIAEGKSIRETARVIGVHPSVVHRDIQTFEQSPVASETPQSGRATVSLWSRTLSDITRLVNRVGEIMTSPQAPSFLAASRERGMGDDPLQQIRLLAELVAEFVVSEEKNADKTGQL